VRIRLDNAGFDRKAFRADLTLLDAAFHRRLEHMAQDVGLPELTMARFAKVEQSGTASSIPNRQNRRYARLS
jgi:hypothetical protein